MRTHPVKQRNGVKYKRHDERSGAEGFTSLWKLQLHKSVQRQTQTCQQNWQRSEYLSCCSFFIWISSDGLKKTPTKHTTGPASVWKSGQRLWVQTGHRKLDFRRLNECLEIFNSFIQQSVEGFINFTDPLKTATFRPKPILIKAWEHFSLSK